MYIGLTENKFKTIFNLHKSSFKLEHKRKVIKCANFAYNKNSPSLGLHHL